MRIIIDLARRGVNLDFNLSGQSGIGPASEEGHPAGGREKVCCGKCKTCTCTRPPSDS